MAETGWARACHGGKRQLAVALQRGLVTRASPFGVQWLAVAFAPGVTEENTHARLAARPCPSPRRGRGVHGDGWHVPEGALLSRRGAADAAARSASGARAPARLAASGVGALFQPLPFHRALRQQHAIAAPVDPSSALGDGAGDQRSRCSQREEGLVRVLGYAPDVRARLP